MFLCFMLRAIICFVKDLYTVPEGRSHVEGGTAKLSTVGTVVQFNLKIVFNIFWYHTICTPICGMYTMLYKECLFLKQQKWCHTSNFGLFLTSEFTSISQVKMCFWKQTFISEYMYMVTFDSVVHVLVLINMLYKERILSKFLRRSSIF